MEDSYHLSEEYFLQHLLNKSPGRPLDPINY